MELSNHTDNYILLVDDEKDVLDLFSEYLTSNGYNIISFDNPAKALEYFYKNPNNCSVVITDYRMPQMSGLDFINKIRKKDTDCKIKTIIVSAYIKDNIPYDKSYTMTIDRILEKPVYLDRLKTEIQQLLTINIKKKIS
ncbi:MAG TPA: response regulator [Nitrososphaeraceae archaeon]|jgi:response regulator RpfG family c-di-GMP phosphodiesterase|nr:response regulator [Nitrososphaeraceae archaeon]HSL12981.1 response regulator [Nitrososphaeraceae archaeon]